MQTTIFLSTFGLIFLAELGDKTQLTALALAMRYPWKKIFLGITLAFITLNLLAVTAGKILFMLAPLHWITMASALLFLYFGVATIRSAPKNDDSEIIVPSVSNAARTAFIMIFTAELGDKTQLVTAGQAARHSPDLGGALTVFLASTSALLLASLLGILVGKQLSRLVPIRWMHWAAGCMFLVFGVVTLCSLWIRQLT